MLGVLSFISHLSFARHIHYSCWTRGCSYLNCLHRNRLGPRASIPGDTTIECWLQDLPTLIRIDLNLQNLPIEFGTWDTRFCRWAITKVRMEVILVKFYSTNWGIVSWYVNSAHTRAWTLDWTTWNFDKGFFQCISSCRFNFSPIK
jgi:hypothetical protein